MSRSTQSRWRGLNLELVFWQEVARHNRELYKWTRDAESVEYRRWQHAEDIVADIKADMNTALLGA